MALSLGTKLLTKRMKRRGLEIQELAATLGMKPDKLSKIRRGATVPSIADAVALEDAVGVDFRYWTIPLETDTADPVKPSK